MKNTFINEIKRNLDLSIELTKRDIAAKYGGSALGITWTVVNPILMLSVYTLVFSQVFKARWSNSLEDASQAHFALNLYCGLIVFNLFAECITRGPSLITSNPNYIKKIKFPLETLGVMVTGSAVIQAIISFAVLVSAQVVLGEKIHPTIILLPILWLPLILMCLGMTWLMSTIGVLIKDIGQSINAIVSMLMFLSPIFYPTTALPEKIRWIAQINPLAMYIESTRKALMMGEMISLYNLFLNLLMATIWAEICFRVLKKSQKHLAEAL